MTNQKTDNQVELVSLENFIGVWDNVFDNQFCEWIKDYFNTTSFVFNRNYAHVQDKQVVLHAFSPAEANYIQQGVDYCLSQYMEKYTYLSNFNYYSSNVLIQKTEPMEGYHNFHCEDTTWEVASRTLAWTVYFNDIDDSGETEFLYQHVKINPKAGRVAIWPGSFTHLHRGNPPGKTKYIATGWYASDIGMNHYRPSQIKK